MYLLLPLKPLMNCPQAWEINWAAIDSAVSVVEFLKTQAFLNSVMSNDRRRNMLVDQMDGESAKIIHLANKSVRSDELKNMVAISIHTGNIYSIMGLKENSSAESPFDSPQYSSYTEYFSKK